MRFYQASLELFQDLSRELDFNLFFSERGHFTLAHSPASLRTQRWRAEVNQHLGINSRMVGPDFIRSEIPELDLTCGGHQPPIFGALYHPPGAIARHDAVAWGYARGRPTGRGNSSTDPRDRNRMPGWSSGRCTHQQGLREDAQSHLRRGRMDNPDHQNGRPANAIGDTPVAGIRDRALEALARLHRSLSELAPVCEPIVAGNS